MLILEFADEGGPNLKIEGILSILRFSIANFSQGKRCVADSECICAYSAHATGFETSPKVTTLRRSQRFPFRSNGRIRRSSNCWITVPTGISIPNDGKIELKMPSHTNGYISKEIVVIDGINGNNGDVLASPNETDVVSMAHRKC